MLRGLQRLKADKPLDPRSIVTCNCHVCHVCHVLTFTCHVCHVQLSRAHVQLSRAHVQLSRAHVQLSRAIVTCVTCLVFLPMNYWLTHVNTQFYLVFAHFTVCNLVLVQIN